MIKPSEKLKELEESYEAETYGTMSYEEALRRFTALWVEARKLNPDFAEDWEDDIESDLAIARVLNGLPSDT